MAAQTWFVVRGGKEEGPYSSTALKDMAAGGRLKPTDLVRRSDVETARPAGQIKGLFPADGGTGAAQTPKPSPGEPSEVSPASKKRLVIVAAVGGGLLLLCCGGLGVLFSVYNKERQAAQQELAEADGLWASGDKTGAVGQYRAILQNHSRKAALKGDELAVVYGRLIDFEFERGNKETAKELLADATKSKVTPSVNHPEAKEFVAAAQAAPASEGKAPPGAKGDVLTADFLPCIAGNVKRYEERQKLFEGGPAVITTETVTFLKDNNFVLEWTITTPGQRPTSGKGSDKFVEKGGVIEWFGRVAIKVGAKPGDEWSGIRGKSNYKLVRFEKATAQGGGGKTIELDRAVIESRTTGDYDGQRAEHVTQYVLERGGGIQSDKTYMTVGGKTVLIRERRLVSSTYQ